MAVSLGHQRQAWFLIDTGSSVTVIDRSLSTELGVTVEGETGHAAGFGGRVKIERAFLETFDLGGLSLGPIGVGLIDMTDFSDDRTSPSSTTLGIIGADLLSRLRAVVDFGERTLCVMAARRPVVRVSGVVSIGRDDCVQGIVIKRPLQPPLVGVEVTLVDSAGKQHTTTTNADGRFELNDVVLGVLRDEVLTVSKDGYSGFRSPAIGDLIEVARSLNIVLCEDP